VRPLPQSGQWCDILGGGFALPAKGLGKYFVTGVWGGTQPLCACYFSAFCNLQQIKRSTYVTHIINLIPNFIAVLKRLKRIECDDIDCYKQVVSFIYCSKCTYT